MWGKKGADDEKAKKNKGKASKEKGPRAVKVAKAVVEFQPIGRQKIGSIILPGEKVDAELLAKKLQEVTASRGRKGFDRMEQIRHLHKLAEVAASVGPQSQLEILGHLISGYFDANLGETFLELIREC